MRASRNARRASACVRRAAARRRCARRVRPAASRRRRRRSRRSGAGRSPPATARGSCSVSDGVARRARRSAAPTLAGDLEPQRARPARRDRARPQRRRASARGPSNVTSTVCALRWRSSRQRALVDEPAGAQDPDAVAERLDLAEDVRGEEHRLPRSLASSTRLAEGDLHQRVQAAGGLVEEQQVGAASRARRPAAPSGGCPSTARGSSCRRPSWKRSISSSR